MTLIGTSPAFTGENWDAAALTLTSPRILWFSRYSSESLRGSRREEGLDIAKNRRGSVEKVD